MDSSLLGLVEMILVLGTVLALAIVELLSLHREKRRNQNAEFVPEGSVGKPGSGGAESTPAF